jgi:hypothetical protein
VVNKMVVNFTGNDTVVQYSNYIGQGVVTVLGSNTVVGLVILLVLALVCYFAHLPLDASAFLFFMAIMFLGLSGLLPASIYILALLLTAFVVSWAVMKLVRG